MSLRVLSNWITGFQPVAVLNLLQLPLIVVISVDLNFVLSSFISTDILADFKSVSDGRIDTDAMAAALALQGNAKKIALHPAVGKILIKNKSQLHQMRPSMA